MSSSSSLPPGWALIPLGNLGEWNGGGTPSKSKPSFWADGSIPWVSPKDMKVLVISDSIDHITEKAVKESAAKLIVPGSVLFVTRSGILAHTFPVARTVVPVTVNQDLKALTPTPPLDPNYIAWGARAYGSTILEQCSKDGTTVASVDTALLHGFRLPIAPLPEQHRIVEAIESYFTLLDDAVATLERVQRNLKRYRASVLKAAVEGRLVPTEAELARAEGRDYEPASVLLARILAERRLRWEEAELAKMKAKGKTPKNDKWKAKYKEPARPDTDENAELPQGWTWTSLEAVTCSARLICYGILMPKHNVPDGVPYVKVRDMRSGVLDVPSLQRTSHLIAAKYPRSTLKGGDLLLAIRGTYGRVVDVPDELDGGNITQDSARLDMLPGVHRRYAKWLLLSPVTQRFFKQIARGVAVKGVNIGDVRATPVPLPPLAEQERIVQEIEDLLSIEEAHEEILSTSQARLARLRQSLLKWAFEGKLADQNPTDEPASVLLDRITAEREAAATANNAKNTRRKKTRSRKT